LQLAGCRQADQAREAILFVATPSLACRASARSAPTLVLIGEKDDWTPAALCQAVESKPNVKVVVFPGATHAFVMPFTEPVDYLGYHFVYDEKAAQDAQQDADAFLAARLK
jgi:dienelactone hydrolase